MTDSANSDNRPTLMPAATKRSRRWLALLTLCGLAGAAWLATQFAASRQSTVESETATVRPLPVNVLTIEQVDTISQSRTYTGTVRAKNRSDLGFEMGGKISEVLVEEGDIVSVDAPLAKLDTATLIAQRNAIVASIEQAKSLLAELESGPRAETISAARSAVDAARSQYDLAETNLKRRQSLFEQGAISNEEFDSARFGLKTASANLKSTQQQLSELEAGTRSEQLDAQSAALQQRRAALAEIEVAISKSTLLAPFSGTITDRYLDPGSIAPASVPVVRLVAEQDLECWIGLPVEMVSTLRVGDAQEILVSGKPYPSIIDAKIRELDTLTRTQTVVFELDASASRNVVSGQLCEVAINSDTSLAGFWIPNTALTKGVRGLWSVMVVTPASKDSPTAPISTSVSVSISTVSRNNVAESMSEFWVEKRDVEILHTESERVLVRGTLETGDRIVVDGLHRIASGQSVTPLEHDEK